MTLKVLSPYVTLRVKDRTGSDVLLGYYAGAPVPVDAHPEDVARLLRKGMLVDEAAPESALAVPAGTPVPDVLPDPTPQDPARPAGNASTAAWVDYAVSKRAEGVSEADARAAAEGRTRGDLIAELSS